MSVQKYNTVAPVDSNHPGQNPKAVALCRWLLFTGSLVRAMSQTCVDSNEMNMTIAYKHNEPLLASKIHCEFKVHGGYCSRFRALLGHNKGGCW